MGLVDTFLAAGFPSITVSYTYKHADRAHLEFYDDSSWKRENQWFTFLGKNCELFTPRTVLDTIAGLVPQRKELDSVRVIETDQPQILRRIPAVLVDPILQIPRGVWRRKQSIVADVSLGDCQQNSAFWATFIDAAAGEHLFRDRGAVNTFHPVEIGA